MVKSCPGRHTALFRLPVLWLSCGVDYFSSTAMANFQKPGVAILEVNLPLSLNDF